MITWQQRPHKEWRPKPRASNLLFVAIFVDAFIFYLNTEKQVWKSESTEEAKRREEWLEQGLMWILLVSASHPWWEEEEEEGEDLFQRYKEFPLWLLRERRKVMFSLIFSVFQVPLTQKVNMLKQYILGLMCSELLCIHRKKETYPLSEPKPRVVKSEQVAFSFM